MSELTKEDLDYWEQWLKNGGELGRETGLSLIAAARELEEMRQQVCVLVREDMLELPAGYGGVHDPEFADAAALAGFRALAEESGWEPTNGR